MAANKRSYGQRELQDLIWDALPLGGSARLVMLLLARYANDEGGGAELPQAFIARCCCLSECQTGRILRTLVSAGWLILEAKSRRHSPHRYGINVDKLAGQLGGSSGFRPSTDDASKAIRPSTDATCHDDTSSALSSSAGATSNHGAYKETRARARSGIYLNTKSVTDQIRLTRVGFALQCRSISPPFGVAQLVELLADHGVPRSMLRKSRDLQLLASWIESGFTDQLIRKACERSQDVKRRRGDTRPLTPSYLAKVLESIRDDEKCTATNTQRFDRVDYDAGVWSRRTRQTSADRFAARNAAGFGKAVRRS